jgi:putative restriction endonuclease
MGLAEYQDKFRRLVVNTSQGRASPHKICMLLVLLVLLDLARAGALTENRVYFAPPILERYEQFFSAVRTSRDHANPYFPFFHLAGNLRGGGATFWHLQPLPGREAILSAMGTARSIADITTNIAYAQLDPELFNLLQDPACIDALGEAISVHWLDRGLAELRTVVAACGNVSSYERRLRGGQSSVAAEGAPPEYVRNPAFRRVVTELYDYRCAATGLRIVLPTGEAMVEAAHIHPFSEAGDDDPRNGLALCPDMHWAMDRNLIAPGTDLKWHVSFALDVRIPDFVRLVSLEGMPVLLPREARYAPKRESLEWRMDRLGSQSSSRDEAH